jgi:nitrogen fixation/metabolism regulation signal transduction histidine kinase
MVSNSFRAGVLLRVGLLAATLAVLAWMLAHTVWYVTTLICAAIVAVEVMALIRYAARTSQEVARFLDAIAFDDNSVGFAGLMRDRSFRELGASMTRVLDQLRRGRVEREEQAQYLQGLLAHMPVALLAVEEDGDVQLLNLAARRLFGGACAGSGEFARYGAAFVAGMENLRPGDGAIIRMERAGSVLPLKASATEIVLRGRRRRLVSLQNIESELSAQELAAWQMVIRVMAHEVMNSLTPITSLASTARDHVGEALAALRADDPARAGLADAGEALDTLARRSEGLLQFVQNHRRLTKRMVAEIQIVPVRRVFSRLQRLLADELKSRDIGFAVEVEPETLEIAADIDLLDQALINLVRNAIEALREAPDGRIALRARQDSGGGVVLAVSDNGPGIAPDQREKVFVPFYTTKRQGSGVGLSLVRQIAAVHNGSVAISDSEGGGATISMRF